MPLNEEFEHYTLNDYAQWEGEYGKIDDYSQGSWSDSIEDCAVDVDFSCIWNK